MKKLKDFTSDERKRLAILNEIFYCNNLIEILLKRVSRDVLFIEYVERVKDVLENASDALLDIVDEYDNLKTNSNG